MSFTPGFAPDAASQLREMAPEAQEFAIDELDRLTLDPPKEDDHVAAVSWDQTSLRHTVFVHVLVDRDRQLITVVGVGHVIRRIQGDR
jgi:hypothetical protein